MRGRFIKKIERPKGYVNIDEVYEMLDGVEKEEDYEYGDFGEVLSKWATCDYGEVLDAISCCDAVKAIPLAKVKQAREEIEQNAYPIVHGVNNRDMGMTLNGIFQVLDKLIAESEG